MLERLSHKARVVLALSAVAVLVNAYALIALTNPKNVIRRDLPDAFIETDLTPDYDVEKVRAMFGQFSPEHFDAFKRFYTRHDLFFPPAYTLSLVVLLWLLWSSDALRCHRLLRRLAPLLPLAVMAFDYGENYTMYRYASSYPAAAPDLLTLSRSLTGVKWLAVLLCDVWLLSGLLLRLRDRRAGCRA